MKISDLGAVVTFAKVVELKSFRAAARSLGVPPSTVSHKVAQLEDRLGAPPDRAHDSGASADRGWERLSPADRAGPPSAE
jgi:hypothetical protein